MFVQNDVDIVVTILYILFAQGVWTPLPEKEKCI